MRGKVIWFSSVTGSGFAEAEDGREVFLCYENLDDNILYLDSGEVVEFKLRVDSESNPKKLVATEVRRVN